MENNEAYALPDLSSTPIDDLELVEEHLRPAHQCYMSERRSGCQARVNAGLPLMNPWDLIPAVSRQAQKGTAHKDERRREKYFVTTDRVGLSPSFFALEVEAPQGLWKPRGRLGWVITDKSKRSRCVGYKMTYDFCTRTGHPSRVDTKTNWIMNVYALIDHENDIQEEMFLCHVFENNSPDYDPRPKRAWLSEITPCRDLHTVRHLEFELPKRSCGSCSYEHSGKPCNESLSTHHGSDRPSSDPRLTSFMAQLENILLGDDPEISTDAGNYDSRGDENGRSGKRPKTAKSDVWQRFTKIYAHGPDGVPVTLAACNHCCKVLTGDSKKHGTSHLKRHMYTGPCNH